MLKRKIMKISADALVNAELIMVMDSQDLKCI